MPSEAQKQQIKWALDTYVDRADPYIVYSDYYSGKHPVMIDLERRKNIFGRMFAQLSLNLTSPVADSLIDRLQIKSFSHSDDDQQQIDDAMNLWKRNRMARRAGQVHQEAVVTGDSYIIVWPDPRQQVTFYPQRGRGMVVEYDRDEQGRINRASKIFQQGDLLRVTLYYPNRIEKWAAPTKTKQTDEKNGTYKNTFAKPDDFTPYRDTANPDGWRVANPYDIVPVFHFANNADLGEYGVSELNDAIYVQNMVNWFAFQLLIGVEYHAMLQRYATGIEADIDPTTGAAIDDNLLSGYEKIWQLPEGATVGVLPSGDINSLSDLIAKGATWMALVTQTPVHYFQLTANLVSGEAQKTAEQKLDAKVNDRQISFGDTWSKAMELALLMDGNADRSILGFDVEDAGGIDTNWQDTKPRNDTEFWANQQVKQLLGVSNRQLLREAGYTDAQIDQFLVDLQQDGFAQTVAAPPGTQGDGAQLPGSGQATDQTQQGTGSDQLAVSAQIMANRMQQVMNTTMNTEANRGNNGRA